MASHRSFGFGDVCAKIEMENTKIVKKRIRIKENENPMRIFLLFSVLLLFTSPCCATRSLYEIVRNNLYRNVAFPVPSGELLQKIRACSDNYETKILENLHKLAVALMRDLLAFLEKDAPRTHAWDDRETPRTHEKNISYFKPCF